MEEEGREDTPLWRQKSAKNDDNNDEYTLDCTHEKRNRDEDVVYTHTHTLAQFCGQQRRNGRMERRRGGGTHVFVDVSRQMFDKKSASLVKQSLNVSSSSLCRLATLHHLPAEFRIQTTDDATSSRRRWTRWWWHSSIAAAAAIQRGRRRRCNDLLNLCSPHGHWTVTATASSCGHCSRQSERRRMSGTGRRSHHLSNICLLGLQQLEIKAEEAQSVCLCVGHDTTTLEPRGDAEWKKKWNEMSDIVDDTTK